MKKTILVTIALLCGLMLFGQGKVKTRKYLLSDFTDKITKVVLPGNGILESALRQEVTDRWTASPFEFCTLEEFEQKKSSSEYYFLIPAEGRFKDETAPGITFLTLVKGGAEGEGLDPMTEIISLPLTSAGAGSGRELVYLSALVEAIQSYTLAAMGSEKTAYLGYAFFNDNYIHKGHIKRIYLSKGDLSPKVTQKDIERYVDAADFILTEEDDADAVFNSVLIYELAVIKQFAEPLLFNVRQNEPAYYEAKRLLKFLEYFVGVDTAAVPTNSLLREFVGGGCFHA